MQLYGLAIDVQLLGVVNGAIAHGRLVIAPTRRQWMAPMSYRPSCVGQTSWYESQQTAPQKW